MKKNFRTVVILIVTMILGIYIITQKMKKLLSVLAIEHKRKEALLNMFREWLTIKVEKKEIHDYLQNNGYKVIAIYGMNYVGEILWKDLKCSDINVKYGIDKNAEYIRTGINVLNPDDELPEVDLVIVTAITYFDEIKNKLSEKMLCPIVSLENILSEIL